VRDQIAIDVLFCLSRGTSAGEDSGTLNLCSENTLQVKAVVFRQADFRPDGLGQTPPRGVLSYSYSSGIHCVKQNFFRGWTFDTNLLYAQPVEQHFVQLSLGAAKFDFRRASGCSARVSTNHHFRAKKSSVTSSSGLTCIFCSFLARTMSVDFPKSKEIRIDSLDTHDIEVCFNDPRLGLHAYVCFELRLFSLEELRVSEHQLCQKDIDISTHSAHTLRHQPTTTLPLTIRGNRRHPPPGRCQPGGGESKIFSLLARCARAKGQFKPKMLLFVGFYCY
jgi:hypothetical protein